MVLPVSVAGHGVMGVRSYVDYRIRAGNTTSLVGAMAATMRPVAISAVA